MPASSARYGQSFSVGFSWLTRVKRVPLRSLQRRYPVSHTQFDRIPCGSDFDSISDQQPEVAAVDEQTASCRAAGANVSGLLQTGYRVHKTATVCLRRV
jgi:hypothetical protein